MYAMFMVGNWDLLSKGIWFGRGKKNIIRLIRIYIGAVGIPEQSPLIRSFLSYFYILISFQ